MFRLYGAYVGLEKIRCSSIMMGHNGSYKPDLDPLDCLAALAIGCLYTGLIGIIFIAEKTDLHTSQQETTAERR